LLHLISVEENICLACVQYSHVQPMWL